MRGPSRGGWLAVLAFVWAGCPAGGTVVDDDADDDTSGDDDDETGDDDDTTADDDDTAAPDCSGGSGALAGGQFFVADGGAAFGASAWLYVPQDVMPCTPLLLFGHGGSSPGGTVDGVWNDMFLTQLMDRAEQRGFAFVVPYLEDAPHVDHTWNLGQTAQLDAMIDEAAARLDVDLADVLFVGTSAGGHMACYYGLYEPARLARVGVISAGLGAYFDYPTPPPEPRLPFLVAHDPADQIVPYSYSEYLAERLAANGHDHEFHELELPGNHHGWIPPTTDLVLDWWFGARGDGGEER